MSRAIKINMPSGAEGYSLGGVNTGSGKRMCVTFKGKRRMIVKAEEKKDV